MKILVVGDLHGRKPKIKTKNFDAVVFVGDVCDDREIAPWYRKYFRELKKKKDLLGFEEFVTSRVGKKEFNAMEKRSLKGGRKVMEYLNSFGKPVFMVPGNWDYSYGKTKIKDMDKNDYFYFKSFLDFWLGDKINPKLTKSLKNIKDCQYRNHIFNQVNFIGYGLSSNNEDPLRVRKKGQKKLKLTAFQKKIVKKAYEKISDKLFHVYKRRDKQYPTIFITHNVPYKTNLDVVRDKKSPIKGKHVGSAIAREFVKNYQPVLCIGGHVHDNFKKQKLGKTLCINAGFGYKGSVLVEFDEVKGKVKNVKFLK